MDAIALAFAAATAWLPGVAALLVLRPAVPLAPGEGAWIAGAGYLVGAFALTIWMRLLSRAGVPFGTAVIALPLIALGLLALAYVWRRDRIDPRAWLPRFLHAVLARDLAGWWRVVWFALLAWLAIRFALLAVEVASRPLYPWDAWTQWATKARVWFEFRKIVPFARVAEWYAAGGNTYFDASPEYPPTVPLLQVWNCIVIGRWDDALMNAPWWQIAVALAFAVYGGLRLLGTKAFAALVGAFLAASLPLANVHVALAGYADLPMAAYYAAAVLALVRWSGERGLRNAAVIVVLAIACTQIKNPGWIWAATLVPAAIVVILPRYGMRVALIAFGVVAFAFATLARMKLTLWNYRLDLDFDPPWRDLLQSFFLLGNWNLLWFGAVTAAALAWKDLASRELVPMTMAVAGGLLFLFFVFAFTNASAFIADQTTVNRATLHLAPLMVCYMVLAFQSFARRIASNATQAQAALDGVSSPYDLAATMTLFAVTIFTSAFLLFLVQPIVAKQVLPWFGGSASVWATCLVFFQTTLLLGYAYADLVIRKLSLRTQFRVHALLLAVSLFSLPIVPAASWKPTGTENPVFLILGMLAFTVGLPYFLLSTTSPLLQAWFARGFPGRNPYRLFALSNLASLIALLGYPFLLEPWVATRMQAYGWSVGYALFVLLAAAAAWAGQRSATATVEPAPTVERNDAPPTAARQILWCTLAGAGSVMLLAVSNHITQNVASVPLLWVVPLSIYLVTFILCFDGKGWYRRDVFLLLLSAALGVMAWAIADSRVTHDLELQLAVFGVGLFVACMFCHGELVLLKPAPAFLTRFYLMVSLGGALGAAVVGILAPLVLPADFELNGVLVLCAILLLWQTRRDRKAYPMLATLAIVSTLGCAIWGIVEFYDSTIVAKRNFYGVLRVQEAGDEVNGKRRQLIHGNIMHGKQYLRHDLSREATSYYSANSGIGRVIELMHPRKDPIKVGVIGLGTGTIATYGAKGDIYRFYDINPAVIEIARRDFTYLADSDATIELPLGDARLTLEREPPQNFDVLAIDAFSSDAIPVHLITREAVEVYLRHMKPDGVIAFHVTNRYLDLVPVVEGIAHELDLHALWINDEGNLPLANSSSWVLLAKDPVRLSDPRLMEAATNISARRDWRVWTDDFNNLLQVLK